MVMVVMSLRQSRRGISIMPAGFAAVVPSPMIVAIVPELVVVPVMVAVMFAMLNPLVAVLVLVVPVLLRKGCPRTQRQPYEGYQSHPECFVHNSSPAL
jgi:hypothetical protein